MVRRLSSAERERTKRACNPCRKRKNKCDGLLPCKGCSSRKVSCDYEEIVEATDPTSPLSPAPGAASRWQRDHGRHGSWGTEGVLKVKMEPQEAGSASSAVERNATLAQRLLPNPQQNLSSTWTRPYPTSAIQSHPVNENHIPQLNTGFDERIEVPGVVRWLQDPNGRLSFIGEASSFSCLQYVRTHVDIAETTLPRIASQFTQDEMRLKVPGSLMPQPEKLKEPVEMPSQAEAATIANCFFASTRGLVEILDRTSFDVCLVSYYQNPSSVRPSNLCLIYLVLASGLVLDIQSQSRECLGSLPVEPSNFAELFYQSGRLVGVDRPDFEDGDIWSVQARTLMALYLFLISRWNPSYEALGSASRTAVYLGLHRIDHPDADRSTLRRHLWRSIYVLDGLLSEATDRPLAIRTYDFSEGMLETPKWPSEPTPTWIQQTHLLGLDAVVNAVNALNNIGQSISKRETLTICEGQSMLETCKNRLRSFHPALNLVRFANEKLEPAEGFAILHANVLEAYCQLVATRPYFLHIFVNLLRPKLAYSPQLNELAGTCLEASKSIVAMLFSAFQSQWLPSRHAFIINFLFASGFIIMCNELVGAFPNSQYPELETNIMTMISAFSGPDAQGQRLYDILFKFGHLAQQQRLTRLSSRASFSSSVPDPALQTSPISTTASFNSHFDSHSYQVPGIPLAPHLDAGLAVAGGGGEGSAVDSSTASNSPALTSRQDPSMAYATFIPETGMGRGTGRRPSRGRARSS